MLLDGFASISEINFRTSGKFVLFRFSQGDEVRYMMRAHKTLSHTQIAGQLHSAVERSGWDEAHCRIIGGGFITKRDDKYVILLDGESEALGPVSRMGLAHLIAILEESFPGFRILYSTLVVSDED